MGKHEQDTSVRVVYPELSPLDQVLAFGRPQIRLLVFERCPDVATLNRALANAIRRFPQLAARLAISPEGVAKLVPHDNAPCVVCAAELDGLSDPPREADFHPLASGLDAGTDQAVFAAILTPLKDGAVLGVRFSQALGDATSLYLVLRHLCDEVAAISGKSAVATPTGAETWPLSSRAPVDDTDRYAVWRFSSQHLEALRAEVAHEGLAPTLNEVVTAHVLRKYGPWFLGRGCAARLRISVGLRGLHPDVPPDYVGNAFVEAMASMSTVSDDIEFTRSTVRAMRHAVAAARNEVQDGRLAAWCDDRVAFAAGAIPRFDSRRDIVSTSHTRVPLHTLDFGSGPPRRVFAVSTAPNGFVILSTDDGLEVHAVREEGAEAAERGVPGLAQIKAVGLRGASGEIASA